MAFSHGPPLKLRSENANRMRRIARVISDLILMKEKVFGLAQKVRDRATEFRIRTQNSELEKPLSKVGSCLGSFTGMVRSIKVP